MNVQVRTSTSPEGGSNQVPMRVVLRASSAVRARWKVRRVDSVGRGSTSEEKEEEEGGGRETRRRILDRDRENLKILRWEEGWKTARSRPVLRRDQISVSLLARSQKRPRSGGGGRD